MAEFSTHFDIPYTNASSPRQSLDLYIPPTASPSTPLFVWIHGGAWQEECKENFRASFAPLLVKHTGLPVACVEYRLSPQVSHPTHILDVIAGFETLTGPLLECEGGEAKWDRKTLVIGGHSVGAWMTTTLVLRPPPGHDSFSVPSHIRTAIKRAIPVVGIYDHDSTLEEYPDYREWVSAAFPDPSKYKTESPARWDMFDDEAGRNLRFLVIQSWEDELVSPRQARVLIRRLRQIYGNPDPEERDIPAEALVEEEEKKELPPSVEVDFDSVGSTHMGMLDREELPRRIGQYLQDMRK